MFELPSLWNLILSTVAFFVAARYLHHYLQAQGLPAGMTRGTLVFVLASLLSWGVGEAVDWTAINIQGPQPTQKTSTDLTQLLKTVNMP